MSFDRFSVTCRRRCCWFVCLLSLMSSPLQANPIEFNIPGQNLAAALQLFSQQSSLQLFYRSELAYGKLSVPVSGVLSTAEALTRLLAESGLSYRYTDNKTITLFIAPKASLPLPLKALREEEVRVLGSHIRHGVQYDRSPPVSIIDRDSMATTGTAGVPEMLLNLPFNSGAEVRVNNLSQPLTAGTAAVNLRNLGLNSTMVLVNGHRQTLSPVATTQGETFVDLHGLMPVIMIERMEVLRGGASSSYGSDAVAGVINIIPRSDFKGLELNAEYQQSGRGDQSDSQFELIFGTDFSLDGGGREGRWVIAASLLEREALATVDRDFTRGTVISRSGQPGTYRGSTGLITDPGCGISGGMLSADSDFCLFDASAYFDLVPEEQRRQLFSLIDLRLSSRNQLRWGLGYAGADVAVRASPSFPFATKLPLVPVSNPGNLSNEPLLFQGRVLGADAGASSSASNYRKLHSHLELETVLNQWSLSSMLAYGENQVRYGREDVVKDRLQAALDGVGGSSGDQTWNPLHLADNPEGLATGFFADWGMQGKTRLTAADIIARSDWSSLWALDYAMALGVHYRREYLSNSFADEFNNNQFYALGGGPDFSAERDVSSIYAEFYFSWEDVLELQLAGRYEDYGEGIDSLAPMLATLWRWNELVSIRASYSRAFRAPSLFQTGAIQSVPSPVVDALNSDGASFRNVLTHGSKLLRPEQADVFNIGISLKPWRGLSTDVDIWYFDYQNLILKEAPQQIIDLALAGDGRALGKVERDVLSGEILRINADFINAASVETSGVDWALRYQWANGLGQWQLKSGWSYVSQFDIKQRSGSPLIDAVGSRNATTPAARSLPEWRSSSFLNWHNARQKIRLGLNFTDSYRDDKNNNRRVESFSTVDIHYRLNLGKQLSGADMPGLELGIGLLNAFDRMPPGIDDFLGYDGKLHDPRGRLFSLSFYYRH